MLYAIIGIIGGMIAGMGMGGGTLLIPLLTVFTGMEQKTAQAINLISFIPMAAVTLIIHAKNKLLDKKSILYVVLPALITCVATSFAVGKIPSEWLRRGFGIFLVVLGAVSLADAVVKGVKRARRRDILIYKNVVEKKDGEP